MPQELFYHFGNDRPYGQRAYPKTWTAPPVGLPDMNLLQDGSAVQLALGSGQASDQASDQVLGQASGQVSVQALGQGRALDFSPNSNTNCL
ncbi:hypothetical protein D3C72_1637210 [compost metagenome]